MTEPTLCLPCALALRPPVSTAPHGCPGQLRLVSGTGEVRVVLCGCVVCWPERSADWAGEPFDHLGSGQGGQGPSGQHELAVPQSGADDDVRGVDHPRVDQDRP